MNKLSTKNLCEIALLTALYCVLSAMMKIPFIGAISRDLGYVALAIGCVVFGMWGAFVGAVGCGIESILFSPYGFSIGWFVANLIVGLGCGYVFTHTESTWKRIIAIIIFVGIGMLGAKTLIECTLQRAAAARRKAGAGNARFFPQAPRALAPPCRAPRLPSCASCAR